MVCIAIWPFRSYTQHVPRLTTRQSACGIGHGRNRLPWPSNRIPGCYGCLAGGPDWCMDAQHRMCRILNLAADRLLIELAAGRRSRGATKPIGFHGTFGLRQETNFLRSGWLNTRRLVLRHEKHQWIKQLFTERSISAIFETIL